MFLLLACVVALVDGSAVDPKGCGVPVGEESRIIGGWDVGSYRYPWFALFRKQDQRDQVYCSGTLITRRHVLTAAHCFDLFPNIPNEKKYTVILGVYNKCEDEATQKEFNLQSVVIHEQYQKQSVYDIAVLTLDGEADFTPACLPGQVGPQRRYEWLPLGFQAQWSYVMSASNDVVSRTGLIAGFGLTRLGDAKSVPCTMRQVRIDLFTYEECLNSRLPTEDVQLPGVMCAGYMPGGMDACQGDSGSGLMTNENGRFVIKGIVSFGYGCGSVETPGVYTNVTYYLDWVQNHTTV